VERTPIRRSPSSAACSTRSPRGSRLASARRPREWRARRPRTCRIRDRRCRSRARQRHRRRRHHVRIALVSTPFVAVPPKEYGGTELVVSELAEGLVARGHEVTVFATGDSQTSAELRYLYPQAQWPPNAGVDM